jgi:hypothetical protein
VVDSSQTEDMMKGKKTDWPVSEKGLEKKNFQLSGKVE